MKKILKKGVCLLIAAVMLLSGMSALAARVTSNPMVFVIGDSTACVYSEASLQTGWAQVLYNYFNDPYMISDCAVGGASSRSFYNNYWANVKSQIKEGDYVIIQFGHNDCKGEDGANDENEDINPDAITSDRYANPDVDETVENSFKWYLKKYVDEIEAIGATPIFVTSVERRLHAYYNAENSRLYRWVTAMQDYAAKNDVAIIDIWEDTRTQIVSDCPESTSYHPWYTTYTDAEKGDNVHLTRAGAMAVSKMVCEKLAASDIALKSYLKPDLNSVVYEELPTKIAEDFDDAATGVLSLAAAYNGWSAQGIMDTTKSPYMQIATDSADAENKVMNFYRDGSVNTDTDSKIMYLIYSLSNIMGADSAAEVDDSERYVKLKYSFRPNVQGNKFNVLIGGLGTVSLDMSKSCVRYDGASDTKLTYQNGSWYETEIYVDLKEQKLSVSINGTQYFKESSTSKNKISYIQFYPDRYDAETATGNLNFSYDLDDISFSAIDEDTYRNEVGVLGDGELIRESFNSVTSSATTKTTTDAGWHKEYERDTTKSTITAGVDGENNVASFKRMTSDYSFYHRLRYNLGETLTDGYYSLKFKLKSASATNELFRVFFFDDDTTHTNEWVELYFNKDTAKKFYRRVKDGAYDREALTKSFAGKAVTEWYNIEIIFNLTDAEIGKTSLYIDGELIFNDILADYKSSKTQNNGKLSGIAFGMGSASEATTLTDTDTTTVDAEYMLDDIVMKKLDTETTGVISADGKVTGISVDMGWIPAASQKFVAAVYEADEEGAPAALKGVSTAAASARGTSTLTLSKQLAYSEGDIIKVYYWDMGMLKPVGTLFSKTAQ